MFRAIATAFFFIMITLVAGPSGFALEPIKGPANSPELTGNGQIMGSLGYPSDEVPALQIVAFLKNNPRVFYRIDVPKGQSSFTIPNVPPGEYVIVAYPTDNPLRGGYTKAVACGLEAKCTDHSLVPVIVSAGKTASGVALKDWYAPDQAFPPKP